MFELNLEIKEIYHDWFKDTPESNDTAATQHEILRILAGLDQLPPNAIVHFNVGINPPTTLLTDIPTPLSLRVSMKGISKDLTETYSPGSNNPEEGQLGKVKPGKWNRSGGYNGLFVTYAPGLGPHEMTMQVYGTDKDGVIHESNIVRFPYIAGY
jgi:hypothetical protein